MSRVRRVLVPLLAFVSIAWLPADEAWCASTGTTIYVALSSVEGPGWKDFDSRDAFFVGLRRAFGDTQIPIEKPEGKKGAFVPDGYLADHVRLWEGPARKDAWLATVNLEWMTVPRAKGAEKAIPADRRLALRALCSVAAPEGSVPAAAAKPLREDLLLVVSTSVPARQAEVIGHRVGRLVLEAVHRQLGDLPADRRIRIEDTGRKALPPPR